jgi:hypothetical protein
MITDRSPSAVVRPRNPYVEPRAFRERETLPNRERAARELTDLVIAERVVLLHAPSGAGKTSLIQAAVSGLLTDEGFHPTKATRVDRPLPDGVTPANRYVFSVALDLLGSSGVSPAELAGKTLSDVLAALPPVTGRRVLVLDQIEEILTLDPTDWENKEEFFRQLGRVLRDGTQWALLAMREDYMGGLDHYVRFLPGQLRSRYRLDFLLHEEALAAMQKPARSQGVTFEDDAARELVHMLADTRVDRPGADIVTRRSRYVEPFQLQVVCRQLWKDVRELRGDNFPVIQLTDVQKVNIGGALGRYYGKAMDDVEKRYKVNQRIVRDWFEDDLITLHRFRSPTTRSPVPGEPGDQILNRLMDAYLIRGDSRAGTMWYELAHDRLIDAVLDENDAWRNAHLPSWQVAAHEWRRKSRQKEYLLSAADLRHAPSPASRDLTDHEREFLRQSYDEVRTRWQRLKLRLALTMLPLVTFIALIELIILVLHHIDVF